MNSSENLVITVNYFINPATEEPMTVQEKRQLYPPGECPTCKETTWTAFVTHGKPEYALKCDRCQAVFLEDY